MSCDVAKGRSIRFIADRVQVDEERSDKAVSFDIDRQEVPDQPMRIELRGVVNIAAVPTGPPVAAPIMPCAPFPRCVLKVAPASTAERICSPVAAV